jgi:hypothetical protein
VHFSNILCLHLTKLNQALLGQLLNDIIEQTESFKIIIGVNIKLENPELLHLLKFFNREINRKTRKLLQKNTNISIKN